MKIIHDRNPLHVKIYLDDKEKEIFKWKYIAKRLEDDLFIVKYYLENVNGSSVGEALKFCREISDIEKHATFAMDSLLEEHCGDCTAFPASCSKCQAEDIIGVYTAPPSKMIGYAIFKVFGEIEGKGIITEEVLDLLKAKQLTYHEYENVIKYFVDYSKQHLFLLEECDRVSLHQNQT